MEYHECLVAIKRRFWLILAAAAFAVLGAWAASRFLMESIYESTATIIVSRPDMSQQDMLLNSNTVRVYYNLAESDSVADGILARLNINSTAERIHKQIGVEADYDTGIMKVTVRAPGATLASGIASAFIASLTEQSDKLKLMAQIQTIDAPKPASVPASPNLPLNMLLAGVGGALSGLVVALTFGAMEQNEADLPALRRFPDLRVLGGLPRLRHMPRSHAPAVIAPDAGPQAEALKVIGVNLQHLIERGMVKTVMITSPRAAEGKTTLAVNLAASMARLQRRVLLVECNARRPALNRLCRPRMPALPARDVGTGLACGTCTVAALGIDMAPEAALPPGQAYNLGAERLSVFLADAEPGYDLILLDCPAVLPYADALLFSRFAQGVVVVADYGSLAWAALERCLARLSRIEANILGVVVNRLPAHRAYF